MHVFMRVGWDERLDLACIGTSSIRAAQFGEGKDLMKSITQITGISNSGEFDGFYVDAQTGLQRGFVAMGSVPEPSSSVLLGLGAALAASFSVLRRARKTIQNEAGIRIHKEDRRYRRN
jgi:PEP-CTERM motif